MSADAAMALFVGLAFGFLVGSAVKGWICGARDLRQAWQEYQRTLPDTGLHRLAMPGKGKR